MRIRSYQSSDIKEMAELFYNTVHTVNAEDYTGEQLDAWADGNPDLVKWDQSFQAHQTLIAEENDRIVGFADIDRTGYLDRLYVHREYQGQGIATLLCDLLEELTEGNVITVHASITAKPFFERRGYRTVKRQQVERRGILLTNYIMEKDKQGSKGR